MIRTLPTAALIAKLAGDYDAVIAPATTMGKNVMPRVAALLIAKVTAASEVGIDLFANGAHPKRLEDAAVQASDVVITMGCGDACPIFPGKRYEDWTLEDPAGKGVESVRPIRDEIESRIRGLLTELQVSPAANR